MESQFGLNIGFGGNVSDWKETWDCTVASKNTHISYCCDVIAYRCDVVVGHILIGLRSIGAFTEPFERTNYQTLKRIN